MGGLPEEELRGIAIGRNRSQEDANATCRNRRQQHIESGGIGLQKEGMTRAGKLVHTTLFAEISFCCEGSAARLCFGYAVSSRLHDCTYFRLAAWTCCILDNLSKSVLSSLSTSFSHCVKAALW